MKDNCKAVKAALNQLCQWCGESCENRAELNQLGGASILEVVVCLSKNSSRGLLRCCPRREEQLCLPEIGEERWLSRLSGLGHEELPKQ